jgi:hypothetical protein
MDIREQIKEVLSKVHPAEQQIIIGKEGPWVIFEGFELVNERLMVRYRQVKRNYAGICQDTPIRYCDPSEVTPITDEVYEVPDRRMVFYSRIING